MAYIFDVFFRVKGALKHRSFWIELFVVPLSMFGVWGPPLFFDKYKDDWWNPLAWFTFGIGSILTIFISRAFMESADDRYNLPNKIVVLAVCIFSVIFYVKAILGGGKFYDFEYVKLAFYMTMFVWFFNFIGKNSFDKRDPTQVLGGNVNG